MPNTAVYLYCLVKRATRPGVARVPAGLPDATRPSPVAAGRGWWAVVAEVPLDMYGPGRLEPRLRDLDWVAEIAVSHEAVVEHFARMTNTTVVPAKLFTMFSSVERALADVVAHRRTLDAAARHVGGCEEWGLRIAAAAVPPSSGSGRTAGAGGAPKSGTAFLQARREARDMARSARAETAAAAEEAYRRLEKLSRDSRLREARSEPGTNPPLLEAAFLVRAGGRARFNAEARKQAAACAAAGAEMTLTGPWPPYNFVGERER